MFTKGIHLFIVPATKEIKVIFIILCTIIDYFKYTWILDTLIDYNYIMVVCVATKLHNNKLITHLLGLFIKRVDCWSSESFIKIVLLIPLSIVIILCYLCNNLLERSSWGAFS